MFAVLALVIGILQIGCGVDAFSTDNSYVPSPGLGMIPPSLGFPNDPANFCSQLEFPNLSWPPTSTPIQKESFELGLNISGSYEGSSGWANLAKNTDGQGLSLGLLQQNLGQGTLQPLLIEIRNNHLSDLQSIFIPSHLKSLLGMLSKWESAHSKANAISGTTAELRMTVIEQPKSQKDVTASPLSAAEAASVLWAAKTLYSGANFIPQWQQELEVLGNNPDFVAGQIEAAFSLDQQTQDDFSQINVNEMRAYLFAFDVQVQDGGFHPEDFSDYLAWVQQNPKSSNTDRLKELLNLRLRWVIPKYVSDVQARKMAIINGYGIVHGESRNLEQEYCYSGLTSYQ